MEAISFYIHIYIFPNANFKFPLTIYKYFNYFYLQISLDNSIT